MTKAKAAITHVIYLSIYIRICAFVFVCEIEDRGRERPREGGRQREEEERKRRIWKSRKGEKKGE